MSQPLKIPGIIDLKTLANMRTLIEHLPKERRQFHTWQYLEAELNKAAAGGDTEQVYVALQMVLMLEKVEYRLKGSDRPFLAAGSIVD